MPVIPCRCTAPATDPEELDLEVRKFKCGAKSPAYRFQCQRCGRKWGPVLDPWDLPTGESPKLTRWAKPTVKKPRKSSKERVRSRVRSSKAFQEQRRRVLERDSWTCVGCGLDDDPTALEVHHARYPEHPEDPVPDSWLQTVCGSCNLAEREERMSGGKGGRIG